MAVGGGTALAAGVYTTRLVYSLRWSFSDCSGRWRDLTRSSCPLLSSHLPPFLLVPQRSLGLLLTDGLVSVSPSPPPPPPPPPPVCIPGKEPECCGTTSTGSWASPRSSGSRRSPGSRGRGSFRGSEGGCRPRRPAVGWSRLRAGSPLSAVSSFILRCRRGSSGWPGRHPTPRPTRRRSATCSSMGPRAPGRRWSRGRWLANR